MIVSMTIVCFADDVHIGEVESFENATEETLQNKRLKDVTGHWAESFIRQMVNEDIITGYEDATFKPENNITVAEFTTMILKACKFSIPNTEGVWYRGAINIAGQYGLIEWSEFDNYKKAINRGEMARIVARGVAGGGKNAGKTKFVDNERIPTGLQGYITTAVEKGIISGYPDGTFRASNNVTRAEAAALVSKILEVIEPYALSHITQQSSGNLKIGELVRLPIEGIPEPKITIKIYYDDEWEVKHFDINIDNINDYSNDTQFRIVCTSHKELNSWEIPSFYVENKWYLYHKTEWYAYEDIAWRPTPTIYTLSRGPYFTTQAYYKTFKLQDGMAFDFTVYIKRGKITKEYPARVENFKYVERRTHPLTEEEKIEILKSK